MVLERPIGNPVVNYAMNPKPAHRAYWHTSLGVVDELVVEDNESALLLTLPAGQTELYVDAPARRAANGYTGSFVGVWPGDKIRFSIDVKTSNQAVADSMRLGVQAFVGVEVVGGFSDTGIPVGEWTRLEVTAEVTLSPSGGYVRARIWPTSIPEGGQFFARNALVQIGPEWPQPIPYFDGDTPGFEYMGQKVFPEWDSTRNYSTSSFEYFELTEWNPTATWSKATQKRYSIGADRGMLYRNGLGVPWSGLVSVSRNGNDSEVGKRYLDGVLFNVSVPPSDFSATLEAFTYPNEFDECIGNWDYNGVPGLIVHGQESQPFDLCYRTLQGDGNGYGEEYTLHFVYGCMAVDSGHDHASINDSPEAETFSFDIHGTPQVAPNVRPSAYFSIDSRKVNRGLLEGLERFLYGVDGSQPILPTMGEIETYFA